MGEERDREERTQLTPKDSLIKCPNAAFVRMHNRPSSILHTSVRLPLKSLGLVIMYLGAELGPICAFQRGSYADDFFGEQPVFYVLQETFVNSIFLF